MQKAYMAAFAHYKWLWYYDQKLTKINKFWRNTLENLDIICTSYASQTVPVQLVQTVCKVV